ncbi:MAG: hypothetical protein A2784_00845 [Candidatus Chisholmbacteria bacterium RIFCSPHIGHO2_01_FULL_48_12]|uniref:Uncharacterized protein n=1 Tax=Candidatus Chisholmbacteria bacterium RIFCSPHIGHO2_01_FULL_48_12 TaxID=1797589 RepID=A0A1G1VQV9_9BACT|nr:MAG: hypothetical protein A2784_00845 [Candidatus Chisholmbacteria bacterium RIFCSPHIGHO2_01_FULL_48_12]
MGRNGFDAACTCGHVFPEQLLPGQPLIGDALECPECGRVLVNGEWVEVEAEAREGATVVVNVAKEREAS